MLYTKIVKRLMQQQQIKNQKVKKSKNKIQWKTQTKFIHITRIWF